MPSVKRLSTAAQTAQVRYEGAAAKADQARLRRDRAAAALADAGQTYEQVGAVFGVSRSRAWQLVKRGRQSGGPGA
jgi:hypothetical protein